MVVLSTLIGFQSTSQLQHCTVCFIDLGKLNLLKISLPWSKSVKQTVGMEPVTVCISELSFWRFELQKNYDRTEQWKHFLGQKAEI